MTLTASRERWSISNDSGLDLNILGQIVEEAWARTVEADLGDTQLYTTTVEMQAFDITSTDMLHFLRRLGDQVAIRGRRRLGSWALLDFKPEESSQPASLFIPGTKIEVILFVPGPTVCSFTSVAAEGLADLVAATCAFALGAPVKAGLMVAPLEEHEKAAPIADRLDPAIRGLGRDSISLDIIGAFDQPGGRETIFKLRNALLTYHAALEQSHPEVIVLLMTASLEALLTPNTNWAKQRATRRFIKSINGLAADAVNEIVAHANCEEAFDLDLRGSPNRRRKDLLNKIYELRSNPSHRGVGVRGISMIAILGDGGSIRAALLSDLTRASILAFLRAPRSFLYGHPLIDPPADE